MSQHIQYKKGIAERQQSPILAKAQKCHILYIADALQCFFNQAPEASEINPELEGKHKKKKNICLGIK